MRISHVAILVLANCLSLSAHAEPLDISDLTLRDIIVEVPGYSLEIEATYGAKRVGGVPSLTEGEVQVAGAAYENYLAVVGDNPGGIVIPGSFSDVTLTIDTASLEVTTEPITGFVDIFVGPNAGLTRSLGTATTAGFQTVPIFLNIVF